MDTKKDIFSVEQTSGRGLLTNLTHTWRRSSYELQSWYSNELIGLSSTFVLETIVQPVSCIVRVCHHVITLSCYNNAKMVSKSTSVFHSNQMARLLSKTLSVPLNHSLGTDQYDDM